MLDRDQFIDSLKGKLRDDVQMIINECQHEYKTSIDVIALNNKLKTLQPFAFSEGLNETDWLEVIFDLCPEVYDQLDFGPIAA